MHKSTTSTLLWEDVRYFVALTREGNLSAAARALGVEHSTVGRRVNTLEKALGVRLFDRLPRGWQLTAEGEELSSLAERMQEEAFAFERAAVGAGSSRGTVRISAPPSLSSMFLVPRLATMRSRWPGISLEVVGEVREVNLSQREADLALRLVRPQDPGLVVRALGKIGLGLYGSKAHIERGEALWEFVGFDHDLTHLPTQKWLAQIAGKRPFALRCNDQLALHGAARAGLGVACLPHYQGRHDPELSEISTSTMAPAREVWLVQHADVRRSPRVRVIADLVSEIFVDSAAWLQG